MSLTEDEEIAESGKARVGIEAGVREKEEASVTANPEPLLTSAVDVGEPDKVEEVESSI